MSIKDLEPEGFTDQMRWHADRTKSWGFYTQGFSGTDIGVWLAIGGTQTLVGYGTKEVALAEAEVALASALEKLRAEVARFGRKDHK